MDRSAGAPEPTVIYEDNHLLVLNKPSGWLVQGDRTGDPSLIDWATGYIREHTGKLGNIFVAPCHRLDRPVSGVLVLARTSKAAGRVAAAFSRGEVQKKYLALLPGIPDSREGLLEGYLLKDEASNTARLVNSGAGGKLIRTGYQVLATGEGVSCVLLHPHTGRSHQLRVHCARGLGIPILGDLRYGAKEGLGRFIGLHCCTMALPHPTRKDVMRFTAQLPSDWQLISDLITNLLTEVEALFRGSPGLLST